MISRVYLDNHTATRPFPSSIEKLLPFYKEHWGATTSPHQMGQELFRPMEDSCVQIFEELGARADDHFLLTSSGAEAVATLYYSTYIDEVRHTGKNHFITTNVEEAAVLLGIKRLEPLGCYGKILSVNERGQVTAEMLRESIHPRSGLVTLSWANGLTGVVHPIGDLASLFKEKCVRLHVDATYVIGKLYFRFQDFDIDFLTFDGQMLHAPQGVGGLLSRKESVVSPLVPGAPGIRIGPMAALAEALQQNSRYFDHMSTETVRLRDKLEEGIKQEYPDAVVFFKETERLPNCCAIGFPGVSSDALLYLLHRKGVYATLGGGHCQKLSHVLIASGIDPVLANSALSFSLSIETTEEEVDYAIRIIGSCANKLRGYSLKAMEPISI